MKKSLYAILGLDKTASEEDLRLAYETLLSQAAPGDDMRRLALKEAWSVLGNPARRAAYDALLSTPQRGTRAVVVEVDEPSGGRTPLWVGMALVVLIGGGFAMRSKRNAPPPPEPARVVASAPVVLSAPQAVNPSGAGAAQLASTSAEPGRALTPQALFEKASASVVRIVSLGQSGEAFAQGSGVVVDRNTVITNCHVTQKAVRIKLKYKDELFDASVHTADEQHDLCKLSVTGLSAPAVPLGKVASLRVGQKVYAIGSPQGLDLTLSDGMVSSLRESPDGTLVQTTAPISPGSSGGGLFNEFGELVGIVTFQMRSGQNLNFAIPVDWIATMAPSRVPDERN